MNILCDIFSGARLMLKSLIQKKWRIVAGRRDAEKSVFHGDWIDCNRVFTSKAGGTGSKYNDWRHNGFTEHYSSDDPTWVAD